MDTTEYLIVGAGVTGLAFADFLASDHYLVIDKDSEPGGHCRSVRQSGFTWDHAGHFLHFSRPEIEAFVLARLHDEELVRVHKRAAILFMGQYVDYPFQRNIHQPPRRDSIAGISHVRSDDVPPQIAGLKRMFYQSCGKATAESFLIPYNEKVFVTDLSKLDPQSLGRFFPQAGPGENHSYNSTFVYPKQGASRLIHALLKGIDPRRLSYGEHLQRIDVQAHVATTNQRDIRYRRLISSAPLTAVFQCVGEAPAARSFTSSKVVVFNLGFDRKGDDRYHWVYFPELRYPFYRVGYYDNVVAGDRMSLYVETAYPMLAQIDFDAALRTVMQGLREAGIVTNQELVAWHSFVMAPAYVHATPLAMELFERFDAAWRSADIYSIGRYGGWRYSSIEDCIAEAQSLAAEMNG